jgi:transglutaminase-like putative cysteine protease
MPRLLAVEHATEYRYARPVAFGEHRLLFRPRTAHDIELVDTSLAIAPDADVTEIQDVFSNAATIFTPRAKSDTLRVVAKFTVRHEGVPGLEVPIAAHAERYPFDYTAEERRDLGALLEPHYPDPEGALYEWTRRTFDGELRPRTRDLLQRIAASVRAQFAYVPRWEEGTQTPSETLALGSGSCRDFALLMMEAVRRLGFAARYVSGYLYDPALDAPASEGTVYGAGATHAWLQVYVPGAGWVPFDPTNAGSSGPSLIRVAYARDPQQALPLTGTWFGATSDYLGMTVDVKVSRLGATQAKEKR